MTTIIRQGTTASRPVQVAGRLGLVARGVVYAVTAALAASIATQGRAAKDVDTVGALAALGEQPYGKALLWVLAAGLAAYAAWRASQAVTGRTSTRESAGGWVRLASALRAAAYLTLAATAVRATSAATSGGAAQQESWTARVLELPGGRWFVGAAGVVLLLMGLSEAWSGLAGRFMRRLQEGRLGAVRHGLVRVAGGVGHAGRGVSYVLVGSFVVLAAVEHDPSRSRGLDGALAELAQEAWGPPLLLLLTVGLATFGTYSIAEARWRRIRA